MNTVKVRDLVIGEGMPKICVPIVGKSRDAILGEAAAVTQLPTDLVEWRVDCFDAADWGSVESVLSELRTVLGNLPLLLTLRTSDEGGERAIEPAAYAELNIKAAQSGLVDMIDVEVYRGDIVPSIIEAAHAAGVKVIASYHDFSGTPSKAEIVERLCYMQSLGADIPKIAVMPQTKEDVMTLLAATEEMYFQHADRPIITMSMSQLGVISRVAGELTGSAVTFGSASKASAPGQMPTIELCETLEAIHKASN